MNKIKTYTFHVSGMHCPSCVLLIEDELGDLPQIEKVKVNLKQNSVDVQGTFSTEPDAIASKLTEPLTTHGYTLSVEKVSSEKNFTDFKIAIPVALLFIGFFILLQKIGLVNLIQSEEVTYGTTFLIGIIASVSTCMAVVGGLVLSMSANFAKGGDKIRPQIYFHIGRLISFFILGGVIGIIGSAFTLGTTSTSILNGFVALILFILGINLLNIFDWSKKLQITMPSIISKHLLEIKKVNHTLTPLLVGAVTFFLPCGFTQSMQFYALSTGNFLDGAMTMFVFSLGTLPVLALLSFSSSGLHNKKTSGIFFKVSGLVVIFFALLNLASALTLAGIIPPLFNL